MENGEILMDARKVVELLRSRYMSGVSITRMGKRRIATGTPD